jgi:dienelactone hydrolase
LLAVILASLAALVSACGEEQRPKPRDPFAYDRDRPLRPRVVDARSTPNFTVQRITYAASDGTRVPALLAVPRHPEPSGCLMYQGGLGTKKEAAFRIWPAATALGFATLTIDPRHTGARASKSEPLDDVLRSPDRVVSTLRENVVDLRRGLDYLERRPECRHKVGYLGTSLGGILGALLAGDDSRIDAAVLTSLGATWRERLLYSKLVLPGIAKQPKKMEAALRKLSPFDPARWVARISPRPVMLVNGRKDPSVPAVDALNLAAAAHDPKTILFHEGGHDPFARPHGVGVARAVADFLLDNVIDRSSS